MGVKRALVSVSKKDGLIDFARELDALGVEMLSTGGTYKAISEAGIPVTKVSEVTGFPEILGGRVKTLHPNVHGGILADRSKGEHMEQLKEHDITPIDMVVVNLYPFQETVARAGVTEAEAVENIDIGGPTMIRAAAKNAASVAVVVDPDDYQKVIDEMKRNDGEVTEKTRKALAQKAFAHTGAYDTAIAQYFSFEDVDFPEELKLKFAKIQGLRYGENPHQRAAYYREDGAPAHSLVFARQLHGKELSFNNILDLEAAWRIANDFTVPTAVVIKHNNPSGVAMDPDIARAYEKARDCDPVSAFGGVIGCNRTVTEELGKLINSTFIEAIIAPAFEPGALAAMKQKEGIRIMEMGVERSPHAGEKDYKRVEGGLLVQDMDTIHENRDEMRIVTKRQPTEKELEDLLFAWRVAKNVKSNAIVFVKDLITVGVGAGQMSRVISSKIASMKSIDAAAEAARAAKEAGLDPVAAAAMFEAKGAVMASDAFFPFRDGLDTAAEVGITAVIEPGGSLRDDEVIAAADEYGMAMVFTGVRHFKH